MTTVEALVGTTTTITTTTTPSAPDTVVMAAGPIETLHAGILLPESVLSSEWFAILAAFVAINTVMYVTLAVAKTLPKVHFYDLFPRQYTRAETRSIHPDAPEPGPGKRGHAQPETGPEPG